MTRSVRSGWCRGPRGLVLAPADQARSETSYYRTVPLQRGTRPPPRALAVHARTLELYRQLELADYVLEHGHKVPAVRLWVKGEPRARVDFEAIASDLIPYAFLQIFPQDEHERLLNARLEELCLG